MNVTLAPVFPIWLIVVLVVIAILLRVGALVAVSRRRGRRPDRRTWFRFAMAVLAVLCLGTAATRPGDESDAERPPRLADLAEEANMNVFLVVDRSLALDAKDFDGSKTRLEGVRADLQTILGAHPTARFGLVSYGDSARVEWPLSPDTWSLIPFLAQFTPYGGVDAQYEGETGVDVAAPGSVLSEQLNRGAQEYPGAANVVYVLGGSSDSDSGALDVPKGLVSGGAVLGYGTEEGADVEHQDGKYSFDSETTHYELNATALEAAADSIDVPYLHREEGSLPADALVTDVPVAAPVFDVTPDVPHPNRIEYYWLFAGIAAALFGVELYGLARHWIRRRNGGVRS
ncbi:vWA domain-containing protein [Mycolicibacterium sediminis]|uniref:vWA domain-containing protein n=1 Tax=Mycolicibacterium sediminis TaxID=1286180 RepID=UPI0013D5C2B2|nr:VWA domain-containing protein [Mycolicibacterium sediminis]